MNFSLGVKEGSGVQDENDTHILDDGSVTQIGRCRSAC